MRMDRDAVEFMLELEEIAGRGSVSAAYAMGTWWDGFINTLSTPTATEDGE